ARRLSECTERRSRFDQPPWTRRTQRKARIAFVEDVTVWFTFGEHAQLARSTGAHDLTPALDIDLNLTRGRAAQAAGRRRTGRDAHSTDIDAVVELALLHQTGDLDHRAFVRFDLGHHLLLSVHAQVHAIGN